LGGTLVVVGPSCCFCAWHFLARITAYDTAIVTVDPKTKLASKAVLEDVLDAILDALQAKK
jgi:hypothetical protein